METTYTIYKGITDYVTKESERSGINIKMPYGVYEIMQGIIDNGGKGATLTALDGQDPLIELVTTEDGETMSQLTTVREYIQMEAKYMKELKEDLTPTNLYKLIGDELSPINTPRTVEHADEVVSRIRTIIEVLELTK